MEITPKVKEYLENSTCHQASPVAVNEVQVWTQHSVLQAIEIALEEQSAIFQEQFEERMIEYFKSVDIVDKVNLGQYILVALAGININTNAENSVLKTEFTHTDKKRYKAKMVITQKEMSNQ